MSADWRPAATLAVLRERAALYRRIRAFFDARGLLEVETPIASGAAITDPALESLSTRRHGPGIAADGEPLWLQTSPEFPMKRLLAAGSGPIWQLCKVFRDGERGRRHHPEFTLLEWYRPGWGYGELMDELAVLVRTLLGREDLRETHITYRTLFREHLGLDPWQADATELAACALSLGISGADALDLDRDGWLDLLLTHRLEPELGRDGICFLTDYPPSQAALARLRREPDGTRVAERLELYMDGLELANGFAELTDASEQRRRFEQDLVERARLGLDAVPLDEPFLAALAAGMPAGAGVALGIDRLLMLHLGASRIDEVLAFPIERA